MKTCATCGETIAPQSTICPFCENNLRLSLEEEGVEVEVMNILKLLQMAYQN